MKKLLLLASCLCIAGAAYAQESALKEAERGLKVEVPNHGHIADILKGAMQDPSTKDNVKTWYLAGKNAFQTWQTGWEQLQVGGNPDKVNMSKSILDGYDYYMKALPMDTIIDEKGKVKTKYSKEIIKTLATSGTNFHDAGVYLYEAKDMPGAYRAWAIYSSLPTMPQLGKMAPKADPDSTQAETYYNMGIFAYQGARDLDEQGKKDEALKLKKGAMDSFLAAARKGQGEVAYDNALAMANELEDMPMIEQIANEAFNKFGKQNYIGSLVNIYVKSGDYDKALSMLNKALEANPNSAVLYNVKGILVENTTNNEGMSTEDQKKAFDEATALYGKAVELDPKYAEALYNYGRNIANQGYRISDDAVNLSGAEYEKLKQDTINPLFKKAVGYLEQCVSIDPENNRQAYIILKNLYYNLGDSANMERIEREMNN